AMKSDPGGNRPGLDLIKDQVSALDEVGEGRGNHSLGIDDEGRIVRDSTEAFRCREDLRDPDRVHPRRDLPVDVRGIEKLQVRDPDLTDPGPEQEFRGHAAHAPTTGHGHGTPTQEHLLGLRDPAEVSVRPLGVEERASVSRKEPVDALGFRVGWEFQTFDHFERARRSHCPLLLPISLNSYRLASRYRTTL